MSPSVRALFRYPVKGLSPEPINEVDISAGYGFPGDRAFAIALPSNNYDRANPIAKRKSEFLMLARYPRLAAIRAEFDSRERTLSLEFEERRVLASVETSEGRREISEFLQPFFEKGGSEKDKLRLVEGSKEHRFTDVAPHSRTMMQAISLINLNSIRELEKATGASLDMRRFRANIVVDGLPAWAEQEMFEQEFALGEIEFRGVWPTSRCAATQVDPDSGERDVSVPKFLQDNYGHQNLGIYISSVTGGTLRIGDKLDFAAGPAFVPHVRYAREGKEQKVDSTAEEVISDQLIHDFGLQKEYAKVIAGKPLAFEFFKSGSSQLKEREIFAKLMVNELFGRLNRGGISFDQSPIDASSFGFLCKKVEDGSIGAHDIKSVLDTIWESGGDLSKVIEAIEVKRAAAADLISSECERIVSENPENVAKFHSGNENIVGWFVGQVMKATSGSADPTSVRTEIEKILKREGS